MEAPAILTAYALAKVSGTGKRLDRAVGALCAAGYGVEFISAVPRPHLPPGVRVHQIGSRAPGADGPTQRQAAFWLAFMAGAALRALRLARRPHVRALLGFSFGGAFPLLPAAWLTGKPLVVLVRSDEAKEHRLKGAPAWARAAHGALEALTCRTAASLVSVSETIRAGLARRHPGAAARLAVLRNDLPRPVADRAAARALARRVAGVDERTLLVCTAARFTPVKNAGLLLDALAALPEAPVHLLLVGDGPRLDALRAQASANRLGQRVTFTGWRDDAATLAAGSDVFVLPSLEEGISNALLEAMANGVLCLASDIPEHREVLRDPALLVPVDQPAALAQALGRIAADAAHRHALQAATVRAAGAFAFDWDGELVARLARFAGAPGLDRLERGA